MRSRRISRQTLVLVLTVVGLVLTLVDPVAAVRLVAQQPCPRAATAQTLDTLAITNAAVPLCRYIAMSTGIDLKASVDGSHPDPVWTSLVRDSRGRFFTAARGTAERILMWNADGSFHSAVGRSGQGPGEIDGTPTLFLGPADNVVAVHGGGRVSIFSPSGSFVRELAAPNLRARRNTAFVSRDGRIVSTGRDIAALVQVRDQNGSVQLSFGSAQATAPALQTLTEFTIAYGGGTSFWLAKATPHRGGYQLEEWSLDGKLQRVITRTATWLATRIGDEDAVPGGGFPFVRGLWVDPDGLIWIAMLVRDAKVGTIDRRQISDTTMSRFFDLAHEVIDPRSGTLLASEIFDEVSEDEANIPPFLLTIPQSRNSYVQSVDPSTGLVSLRILELRLVRR